MRYCVVMSSQLRSYHGSRWCTCVSWLSYTSTNTNFFQSHQLLFSRASAVVRGENTTERNFASTESRTLNHQVMSPTRSPLSHLGGLVIFQVQIACKSAKKWYSCIIVYGGRAFEISKAEGHFSLDWHGKRATVSCHVISFLVTSMFSFFYNVFLISQNIFKFLVTFINCRLQML